MCIDMRILNSNGLTHPADVRMSPDGMIQETRFPFGGYDAEIISFIENKKRYPINRTIARVHLSADRVIEITDNHNYSKWVTEPTEAEIIKLTLAYRERPLNFVF